MATGRKQTVRAEIVAQAALVWSLAETDIAEFIRCGSLGEFKPKFNPALRAAVDAKIDEIRTIGKLVI